MADLRPGLTHEITWTVEERHLASTLGSGLPPVFATPMLGALFEECARVLADSRLPEGQLTVGTWITVHHTAPTPLGMKVRARAELVDVEGRRLRFKLEAWDDVEPVGSGEHERFIVDAARFEKRLAEKSARVQAGQDGGA
ncbi:MAG: thioesterase family protein [Ardenticatenia bacterium]|nr:thioesterase family protein [Ardenticatenia bacterium]